jgi:hypothetical protein
LTNSVAGLVPLASVEGVFEGPLTEHPALVGLVARLASAEKLASVIP